MVTGPLTEVAPGLYRLTAAEAMKPVGLGPGDFERGFCALLGTHLIEWRSKEDCFRVKYRKSLDYPKVVNDVD